MQNYTAITLNAPSVCCTLVLRHKSEKISANFPHHNHRLDRARFSFFSPVMIGAS